ncbi:hypothetical protein [Pseudanabaena sp. PCC 6802]|uniref:hypothetical protein n=1 Tax=Pseudanabaena sp. PCC 6802 TaxID=118173 RepID=UPI0012EAEC04|nr:hypothetical protein [Pseudanabaena sp. PCC 6802]
MSDIDFLASNCSLCAHYAPQGRRGGYCGQLNSLVESKWDACPLFTTPFTATSSSVARKDKYQETAAMFSESVHREAYILKGLWIFRGA